MVFKQKYIKTSDNVIIVFSALLNHDEFKSFNPVSAGFISINAKVQKHVKQWYPITDCTCYGKSDSLGLKADEENDTRLAKRQILGHLPE